MQLDLAEAQGEKNQELAYRLLGNAHEDVLTAFEATLKTVYLYRVGLRGPDAPPAKPVKNAFQNVEHGQRRFAEFDFDPFATLGKAELKMLALNIQKRHVIGHNLGVVDAKFTEHAADARLGETVHLVGEDIRQFAELADQVVKRLDEWLVDGAALAESDSDRSDEDDQPSDHSGIAVNDEAIEELSPLARRLGRWLSESSEDGMSGPVTEGAVLAVFSDVPLKELELAVAELDADGFITTTPVIGTRLPRFRPTLDLFVTFDPIGSVGDPLADAITLIDMILSGDDTVRVSALHAETGWTLRRFNPALELVIHQIDERRVSQEGDASYPARSFILMAPDRVALKRFSAQVAR